ncbi:MAG: hypothetical protein V3R64_03755 [Sphingomonadales bacterium]
MKEKEYWKNPEVIERIYCQVVKFHPEKLALRGIFDLALEGLAQKKEEKEI